MNWYLQNGKESDVVVSSRIRLARNISEFPFETKCTKEDNDKIIEKLKEKMPSIGFGLKVLKLKDMDDLSKMSLVEKRLISPNFVLKQNEIGAIAINEEENICIMINEEDHLRLQVFAPGLEIESLLKLAMELDTKIEQNLSYAYNDKYGFLTACPTNVGTGLRLSVMVHLPALAATGNIPKILQIITNFGMNIRGIYGEGSKSKSDMYQISNKQTLGISEQEIINNMKIIVDKIIEQERLARKYLAKDSMELEDRVYRSYGILSNCKKLSSEESQELLSEVKLGTDLGIIKELTDLKVKKMYLYSKPANLQKYIGKQQNEYERDISRAEIIKQIINNE